MNDILSISKWRKSFFFLLISSALNGKYFKFSRWKKCGVLNEFFSSLNFIKSYFLLESVWFIIIGIFRLTRLFVMCCYFYVFLSFKQKNKCKKFDKITIFSKIKPFASERVHFGEKLFVCLSDMSDDTTRVLTFSPSEENLNFLAWIVTLF